jgi:hypothetical protein
LSQARQTPDSIFAQDDSGQYKMMPANAPKTSRADGWCTSRRETYSEQVIVGKSSKNLMNHGNGADQIFSLAARVFMVD